MFLTAAVSLPCWGGAHQFFLTMDAVLRLLEGLRRELVVEYVPHWAASSSAPPYYTAAAPVQRSSAPTRACTAGDSGGGLPAAALAERVGDFNVSMDPWERTGAAPQGWATHLHQTVLPVQGYIQLRPHDATLPSFRGCPAATAGTENGPTHTEAAAMGCGGKASPSVSIFSRAPICPNTCRHCRSKPCDIATDHDDHICYNCEQRLLFPERIPKWETPSLPICDSWCQECAIAAHGVLTNTTFACSANDEELFSSPLLGARTLGLPRTSSPMMSARPMNGA